MQIVIEEEKARGWRPETLPKTRERAEGCDILSYPPNGGAPVRIEVKGSSAPLFDYGTEVNAEQYERACTDPTWRLEVVANLKAVADGTGEPERLALSGQDVRERAEPWKYRISLDDFRAEERR